MRFSQCGCAQQPLTASNARNIPRRIEPGSALYADFPPAGSGSPEANETLRMNMRGSQKRGPALTMGARNPLMVLSHAAGTRRGGPRRRLRTSVLEHRANKRAPGCCLISCPKCRRFRQIHGRERGRFSRGVLLLACDCCAD